MPVTAVRDEGALRMWVCRLPVHIGPAECTVFTGIYGEFVTSQWADRVVGPTTTLRTLCRGGRLCPPAGCTDFTGIFGESVCTYPLGRRGRCRSQPFATKERYGCGSAACRYTSAHWAAADWSQIPIKTEAVFLVGSRELRGEIEIPPGSFSFCSFFFWRSKRKSWTAAANF